MTDNALRVLAWPAFLSKPWNPYNRLLHTHLQKQGVSVEEVSFGKLLLGRYHIVHIPWPEWQVSHRRFAIAFLRFLRLIVILGVACAKGIRIVYGIVSVQAKLMLLLSSVVNQLASYQVLARLRAATV